MMDPPQHGHEVRLITCLIFAGEKNEILFHIETLEQFFFYNTDKQLLRPKSKTPSSVNVASC